MDDRARAEELYRKNYLHNRWVQVRRLRAFKKTGALFVHIPKTAGVSVTVGLFGADSPGVHRSALDLMAIYGPDRFDEFYTFTFVREPTERLASAYAYLKDGGRGNPGDLRAQTLLAPCSSLDEFAVDWLARPDVQQSAHFRPQTSFVCGSDGDVLVDFVGRFERLEQDYAEIAARLGRPTELAKMNAGKAKAADVSDEVVEACHRFYGSDYDTFGY